MFRSFLWLNLERIWISASQYITVLTSELQLQDSPRSSPDPCFLKFLLLLFHYCCVSHSTGSFHLLISCEEENVMRTVSCDFALSFKGKYGIFLRLCCSGSLRNQRSVSCYWPSFFLLKTRWVFFLPRMFCYYFIVPLSSRNCNSHNPPALR